MTKKVIALEVFYIVFPFEKHYTFIIIKHNKETCNKMPTINLCFNIVSKSNVKETVGIN